MLYQLRLQHIDNFQIKSRCSHGRGSVLSRVRPGVDTLFKMNTTSKNAIRTNSLVAKKLLTDNTFYFVVRFSTALTETFLMQDPQEGVQGKRRFQNETILRALQRAFYNGTKSFAAVDRTTFSPVPLTSIALVCTIVCGCVSHS
jgi:hypothetical protein